MYLGELIRPLGFSCFPRSLSPLEDMLFWDYTLYIAYFLPEDMLFWEASNPLWLEANFLPLEAKLLAPQELVNHAR